MSDLLRGLVAAVALSGIVACVNDHIDPPTLRAARAAGCWRVTIAPARGQELLIEWAEPIVASIELMRDSVSERRPDLRIVRLGMRAGRDTAMESSYPVRFWSVALDTDSTFVNVGHLFGGIGLRLRSAGDSLVGEAFSHSDTEPSVVLIGAAVARPYACGGT